MSTSFGGGFGLPSLPRLPEVDVEVLCPGRGDLLSAFRRGLGETPRLEAAGKAQYGDLVDLS